jgi:hypothetical protein
MGKSGGIDKQMACGRQDELGKFKSTAPLSQHFMLKGQGQIAEFA